MALQSAPITHRAHTIASRITPDRRRHKRVALTLLGRFMRANRQEYPCKLLDISVGGASMMSPVPVDLEERIVAYFDHIGGVEGTVTRNFDGGFAIKFNATQHRREKLAAQLTWLINREHFPGLEERRHERIIPKITQSSLKIGDDIWPCQVIDVSISGASVDTDQRPPIGTEIMLGRLRAKVVRHHSQGIGLQFLDIQAPTALRRHFG